MRRTSSAQVLTKPMLHALVEKMHRMKRIRFADKGKMYEWVDENFAKYDTDKTGALTLEEFVKLYRDFLTRDPEAVMQQYADTASEIEALFVQYDADSSFGLAREELLKLMRGKSPRGWPEPSDEALGEIADKIFKQYDDDKSKTLDFDEFQSAYNDMIDQLNELYATIRQTVINNEGAGLRGMIADASFVDDEAAELAELEKATACRYDGKEWVVRREEVLGDREGGNTIERARKAKKIPILFKHPEQELDDVTQLFSHRGLPIVDIQASALEGEPPEKQAEMMREAIVEAWGDGKVLVLRLGVACVDLMTPDVMTYTFKKDTKGKLVLEVFTDENMSPTESLNEYQKALLTKKDGDPAKFRIREGFQLVITSGFNKDNWKTYLRGKLPLGELQPVQVCRSIMQVDSVLKHGLPKDDSEDAFAKMNALADKL